MTTQPTTKTRADLEAEIENLKAQLRESVREATREADKRRELERRIASERPQSDKRRTLPKPCGDVHLPEFPVSALGQSIADIITKRWEDMTLDETERFLQQIRTREGRDRMIETLRRNDVFSSQLYAMIAGLGIDNPGDVHQVAAIMLRKNL